MRPFKITQDEHDKLMEKFSSYLKNVCLTTNSFSFSQGQGVCHLLYEGIYQNARSRRSL